MERTLATRRAQQLMKGARNGDVQAQLGLGRLYLSGGEGLAANHMAALQWLAQAAESGHPEADALIAECVTLDRAGSQLPLYLNACERAAAQGHPEGYCALGDIYASGVKAAPDLHKAQEAYRAAAQAGSATAARKLGMLLAQDSPQDAARANDEAAHWLHTAAAAGDGQAASSLGKLLWHNGDYNAVRWLEPEAQNGDPDAMYRLGEILCRQTDAERVRRGAYWLERAARKEHPQALWRYGRLHVRSMGNALSGLPYSPLQASRLLERAAAAGVSEAHWDLARIYEMPRFSRRNLAKARQCLEQAANEGIWEAELELGKRLSRYKDDRGARVAAGLWLSRAASKGSDEAKALLERISDRAPAWPPATVRQQEEALERIRDLHPTVAARLELAARFGLSAREMLFINPPDIDREWGIEVDLNSHFKRMPWRLVLAETEAQRLALSRAAEAFLDADPALPELSAATTAGRARQLGTICLRLKVDPALFVRNWKA